MRPTHQQNVKRRKAGINFNFCLLNEKIDTKKTDTYQISAKTSYMIINSALFFCLLKCDKYFHDFAKTAKKKVSMPLPFENNCNVSFLFCTK